MCQIETTLYIADRSGFILAEIEATLVLDADHNRRTYDLDHVLVDGYKDDGKADIDVVEVRCSYDDFCEFRKRIWQTANALVDSRGFEADYMQPLWDEWDADRSARETDHSWDQVRHT